MTSPFTIPAMTQPTGVEKRQSVDGLIIDPGETIGEPLSEEVADLAIKEKTIGVAETPSEFPPDFELDSSFGSPEEEEPVEPPAVDPLIPTGKPGKQRRAPKGYLEAKVKEVVDAYVLGDVVVPKGMLTSYRIMQNIRVNDPDASTITQGAVANTLSRWEELGFIETEKKPYRFIAYTDEAVEIGLLALKKKRRAELKVIRDAAKAEKAAEFKRIRAIARGEISEPTE